MDHTEYQQSRLPRSSWLWRSPFLAEGERQALEQAVIWSKKFEIHKDLVGEAQKADHVLVVASGWVCRYICAPDGGRQITALSVPGDVANLDTLLCSRVTYSVRTLTQATIVALPRSQALALADEHPGIARTFTGLAMVENAIASRWMLSLGRRSARARVAHLICEIGIRLGVGDGNEITFPFPLRQEQIGDMLGLTPVHVNRTVRQLRVDGLIELSDRVLTIPNMAMLQYVAGFDRAYLQMRRQIDAVTCLEADIT